MWLYWFRCHTHRFNTFETPCNYIRDYCIILKKLPGKGLQVMLLLKIQEWYIYSVENLSVIYIIKADVCVRVCQHSNVPTLTSPPILKLWDTQGYLWLPYDLTEVIKLIGVTFGQKKKEFSKKYFMSFLPHYCHSFRITVIPSGLLSFLPDYCHSFWICLIPSEYCHSF